MVELEIRETLSSYGYEYLDLIGTGSFSSVFLCQSKQYNNQFAVKQVMKHKLADDEINALISLIHPSIIKLYATFSDTDHQYLVMEYCGKGTIKQKPKLDYDSFVLYSKQLLEVLDYCHSRNIAHRDIKPENIFLDQYEHVKLGDFNLADSLQDHHKTIKKKSSLMFCSPEILSNENYDPFKADIWALGITFFYMATGRFPFPDYPEEALRNSILFGQLTFTENEILTLNPKVQFLISKMTSKNPAFRPSANKLLKFPIFSQFLSTKNYRTISASASMNFDKPKTSSRKRPQPQSMHSDDNNGNQELDDNVNPNALAKIRSFRQNNPNLPRKHSQLLKKIKM